VSLQAYWRLVVRAREMISKETHLDDTELQPIIHYQGTMTLLRKAKIEEYIK